MLDLHDKMPMLLPTVGRLNNEELFGAYHYRGRRLHYCHQAYVFLLGLLIYHNFEPLRKAMTEEMRETTIELECSDGSFFRYSGGSEYGEFLYRWRLASLCHDMGTGIQLSDGKQSQIARNLAGLPFLERINSIEQLRAFGERDLLSDIEKASGAVKLSEYMEYQSLNPYPANVHHDHAIVSGLIFLRLMYEAYAKHRDNQISINMEGMRVFWGPEILAHSIVQIAKAISMHNIDNYPEAFGKFSAEARVFDMYHSPLVWLLKIADILQEWDKPNAGEEQKVKSIDTQIELAFAATKITVKGFPGDRIDKAVNAVRSFTFPVNAISFGSARA
jgi:hypothetical protein